MLIQQGDVLIKRVSGVKGKKLEHLTLARGEATGHHHTITEGNAELYEQGGEIVFKSQLRNRYTHPPRTQGGGNPARRI